MTDRKKKSTGHEKVQIYGASLDAAIKAMESLGKVGVEILKQNDAANIKDERIYPTTMRSTIYDSLYERYGEPALRAIGFSMGEIWKPIAADKLRASIINRGSNRNKFSRVDCPVGDVIHPFNRSKIAISLDDFVIFYIGIWDFAIKKYVVTEDISYKAYSEKIGKLKYKMVLKSPGTCKRHVALIRENLDGIIFPFTAREWHHNFHFEKSATSEDRHGCRFVFTLEFKKKKILGNVTTLLASKRNSVMDAFLHSVLEYSEKQRNKLEDLSGKLGKYVPPQIHASLFSGKYDTQITTRRKKLTIFFSDIANFTSTSEGLQPEDLTKYLNEYFSEMTAIALNCGATIDKYIGDAMMVFFGDPESRGERGDARACVEMALKMQSRMAELQKKWRNEGFADPFEVRMGMNTGYCNVGNFGSDQRLTYTIIGGEVNVAQRLESAADANGILMSYETYAHAQDMVEVEQREAIKMKGINREIKIFSIKSEFGKRVEDNGCNNLESIKRQDSNLCFNRSIEERLEALERNMNIVLEMVKKKPRQNE